MRWAAIHTTAAEEMLRTSITVGNMNACSRPVRRATSVRSSLAAPKRWTSVGSRTNARTTRMPVICSRSTWFTASIRSCILRNPGTIWEMTVPMAITSTGMLTVSTSDRPVSSRTAMMIPPTSVIGAATSSVQVISTSICTCCTSLVIRVISDGAPKVFISLAEKSPMWWNRPSRQSRPKPIAARDPK